MLIQRKHHAECSANQKNKIKYQREIIGSNHPSKRQGAFIPKAYRKISARCQTQQKYNQEQALVNPGKSETQTYHEKSRDG